MRTAVLFIAMAWGLASAVSPAEAKRVAFVVGVNAYDSGQNLAKAVRDARDISAALKQIGFQVTTAEDVARLDFYRRWQDFLKSVQPGDVAALFFAGHGVELQGDRYLLARDVTFDGSVVLKATGIRVGTLMEDLKERSPQVALFIIDACRNNPLVERNTTRTVASRRSLRAEEAPPRGSILLMSASSGEEALDALGPQDQNPNSVYARFLLRQLRQPGLEITDLAKRVQREVETLARTIGHQQRPAVYSELSGDFFLVPKEAAPPPVARIIAPLPSSEPLAGSEAAHAWALTKDFQNEIVFEAFIQQFPGTVYAAMAQDQLDKLKRSKGTTPALAPPAPAPPKLTAPVEAKTAPSLLEAGQAWAAVKDTTSPTALEAFARQFQGTFYADLALTRIEELKKVAQSPPPPAAISPPAPFTPAVPAESGGKPLAIDAARAWLTVKDSTSASALEEFIRHHAGSVYATLAHSRLDQIRKSQQVAGNTTSPSPRQSIPLSTAPVTSALEAGRAWVTVQNTVDPDELEAFLARYGDSIHADKARARLSEVRSAVEAATSRTAAVLPPPVIVPSLPDASVPAVGISPPAGPVSLTAAQASALKPKDGFQECANCPEMVVVPAGVFTMGSPADEEGRLHNEGPQRQVTIPKPFAVGKFAITFDEWDACVSAGGCNSYKPADEGGRRGQHPVVNVSWTDANAYVAWLSETTGRPYRLPSEAEREYVSRAGTKSSFWFGTSISSQQANYDSTTSYGDGPLGHPRKRALPVNFFAPNPWGLYQVHGNVHEWVQDCWRSDYQNAPTDGTAFTPGSCRLRVVRGGSWSDKPQTLRAANRLANDPAHRANTLGFRVARSL